jgi:hypothetical protein
MPEIKSLTKNVSNYVTIYPYREIEDEDWPAYQDEKGEWVGYDDGWREVGFKCPYPTVARLTQIRDLTQDLTVEDRSFKILGGDPKRAAKFLVYNLIQDMAGLTDQGERVLYDKDAKEWLYNEFCKSSFLLSNFRSSYELVAGKVTKEEKKEEENFSEGSENISGGFTRAGKSGSRVKKEDTPPTLSDGV